MPANHDLLANPSVWISGLSLLVSGCSAFFSWRYGRRALAISENQEKRRQPQLRIYVANGYRRLVPKRQLFGFLVSVSNPTDINNAVARAELRVTYLMENDVTAVCRIQHNAALGNNVGNDATPASLLSLPMRIDAHQTVSGWLLFALDNDVIRNGTIDAHSLILEDTHGVPTETDPIMVREWRDETKKD
ncbi:MAG: hypothetical protein ABSH47_09035 [Bryobacteraceae bacterium]|jgi:hypothetical protein